MLSQDINVITAEINAYQRVAGEAIFEIGRRLKHVKENDLAHGEWMAWLETINMTQDSARRFVRVYEEFGESKHVTSRNLGINALYELVQIPPAERESEHVTARGETKKPEDMTVKELRELKRRLKAEQAERERIEIENEELAEKADKPVEVRYETKTEYVEIDNTPHDYDEVKRRLEAYAEKFGGFDR
ncbi:DUF3102 domain-containing protein [Virgibacillus sp. W0430]|uniref:DUF3102 domain-containing protein n=1 Tax=Virgibacillus sp. W0430 TaxID=3391580 RepID=UPI003F45EC33